MGSALWRKQFHRGNEMNSLFLEGMQSAREIVQNKGLAHLDQIIKELETGSIETTALDPKVETR
jgi:hypothetical protein